MERRQDKWTKSDCKAHLKTLSRIVRRGLGSAGSVSLPKPCAAELCGPLSCLPVACLEGLQIRTNHSQLQSLSLQPSITRNQTVYFSNRIFPG